jgi:septum site-determining protein MinD
MKNPKIINVASGKGGTGKTIFCAILEDLLGNRGINILLVDLDFFVRGLTSLLYFHRKEALYLADENQLTVSDIFINKNDRKKDVLIQELGIARYRSFDVLPSVSRIDELLNYKDIMPDDRDIAIKKVNELISKIPDKYDLIILDCRSGYDELISGIHVISSLTICVEEEDQVSKVTSDNLVKQLQNDSNTPLFRLINKARSLETEKDLEKAKRGINEVGPIPFDMDVLRSFGEPDFWERINRSLYKAGVVKSWNRLCTKMVLNYELEDTRISPLPSKSFENILSLFGGYERLILLYGLIISLLGFGLAFTGGEFFYFMTKDPLRMVGFMAGVIGFSMILGVLFKSKK